MFMLGRAQIMFWFEAVALNWLSGPHKQVTHPQSEMGELVSYSVAHFIVSYPNFRTYAKKNTPEENGKYANRLNEANFSPHTARLEPCVRLEANFFPWRNEKKSPFWQEKFDRTAYFCINAYSILVWLLICNPVAFSCCSSICARIAPGSINGLRLKQSSYFLTYSWPKYEVNFVVKLQSVSNIS